MELYTTDEVAKMLRVSKGAVLSWVKEGRLNSHRLGPRTLRFTQADIDGFIFGSDKTAAIETVEEPVNLYS